MRSPEGWLRALLWYEKLSKPPDTGSLQEIFAEMVMVSKIQADLTKWLVLYRILDTHKTFNHMELEHLLRRSVLPYTEDLVKKSREQIRNVLEDFAKQGPMVLRPEAIVGAEAMAKDARRPHPGMTPMGMIPRKR